MQPTHARWEQVPVTTEALPTSNRPSTTDGRADGSAAPNDAMEIDGEADGSKTTIFPPVDPVFSRNYMVADTYFEGPPKPDMPYPGPDGDMYDIGPKGLCDVTDEVIAVLPEDCKKAFFEARQTEREWKLRWGTEQEDGARTHLPISYNS